MKRKKSSYAELLKKVAELEQRIAALEQRLLPMIVPVFPDRSGDNFPGYEPLPPYIPPQIKPFTPYVPTITSPNSAMVG